MVDKRWSNIFLSHRHVDDERYGRIEALRGLLEKRGLHLKNYSVTKDDFSRANAPEYIKTLLRPQIRQAGVLAVLIGPTTSQSTWVNWEIQYAARLGKRIIGIWGHGAKDSDIPEAYRIYASSKPVGWKAKGIEAAIVGPPKEWTTPAGVVLPRSWDNHFQPCRRKR